MCLSLPNDYYHNYQYSRCCTCSCARVCKWDEIQMKYILNKFSSEWTPAYTSPKRIAIMVCEISHF